jgi:hypothetical protein
MIAEDPERGPAQWPSERAVLGVHHRALRRIPYLASSRRDVGLWDCGIVETQGEGFLNFTYVD